MNGPAKKMTRLQKAAALHAQQLAADETREALKQAKLEKAKLKKSEADNKAKNQLPVLTRAMVKEMADIAAMAEGQASQSFKTDEEEDDPVVSEHDQVFGPEELWAWPTVEEEFYFLCWLGVGGLVATDSWMGKVKNPFKFW